MNIVDYVKWRGDLPLKYFPFNEIDAMILCQITYWTLDNHAAGSLENGEGVCLKEIHDLDIFKVIPTGCNENDIKMAELIKSSTRFGDIRACEMVKETDEEKGIQFCAVTYILGEDGHFVAFRGTDNTLVGWKENMDLAYNEKVPSQEAALDYLERIAAKTKGDLYIGGHSKGGNLAVYSAAFSLDELNDRIKHVYNFDGPGFNDRVIQDQHFINIKDHVHTFVPEASVVGMLLEHRENYEVIHSTKSTGFTAHWMDTWCLNPTTIERGKKLRKSGEILNENIREWIDRMSYDEKKEFIEVVYDMVDDYKTVDKLFSGKNLLKIIKEYKKLEDGKKQALSSAMSELKATIKENLKEHLL